MLTPDSGASGARIIRRKMPDKMDVEMADNSATTPTKVLPAESGR